MPRDSRPLVWTCVVNIWGLEEQFRTGPEQVIGALNQLLGPEKDPQSLVGLFHDLKHVNERFSIWGRKILYSTRNNRFLTSVVTASGLRAVYKEDFSVATEEQEYDPILDLESLTPVASIHLAFNNNQHDFLDFACDLNTLGILIHSLRMTQKQLQGIGRGRQGVGKGIRNKDMDTSMAVRVSQGLSLRNFVPIEVFREIAAGFSNWDRPSRFQYIFEARQFHLGSSSITPAAYDQNKLNSNSAAERSFLLLANRHMNN